MAEPTNEDRAARIDAVYDAAYRDTGDGTEEFVTDLLADLMHFCDREELDFLDRLTMAEIYHGEEV